MSFPGLFSTARPPKDQEIFQVRNMCSPLEEKLFVILGEATSMASGKYYNCFGWALQKPTDFVDPYNHAAPFNEQWVNQQRKDSPQTVYFFC
jgi:hypothetical protein